VNPKRTRQVVEVATPYLMPGEHVQLATIASIGSVSLARKAAVATAVGIASGGMLIANVKPRRMYIAVTERSLLFFEGNTSSGRPGKKLLMRLDKQYIATSEPRQGWLTLSANLAIEGQPKGLKITFPRPCREDGERLLAGLRRYPARAA
jgi:hypothetical protein